MTTRTQTTSQKFEALVVELDKLAETIDIEACRENLYDLGITEPAYDSDDADKLAYAIKLRQMISSSYGA